ncbi:imidazole glycerol phosphate synthase subunit HisH [Candidatus Cyanaurora vandensis]|uniref:imidazole glycerol phosphate synthase subunit HisH n=1 Tax=Candidatus Cyanaurora vandensis TaxID=2714958 RepID=UPI00257FA7B7|nr:imidazole glycerol phosphate synthase subunit HisH [Candidatus Cyanaurora vandensis]
MRLALIDYGAGNLHSARRAFEFGGATVEVTADPGVLAQADGLVLPGVGAFDPTMTKLEGLGLREVILAQARRKPLLGICIGLQVLFEGSEEGSRPGLGLIPGVCRRFHPEPSLNVPHMGWNQLETVANPLWTGLAERPWVYYVHTYFPVPTDPSVVIARSQHGHQLFCAAVQQGLVWGTQFHPEKSSQAGLQIVRNFLSQVAQTALSH